MIAQTLLRAGDANDIALCDTESVQLTYRELRDIVKRTAQDVKQQQTATLIFPNSVAFVVLFLALTEANCAVNPLNPTYNVKELEFFISDTQSDDIYVCASLMGPHLVELCQQLKCSLAVVELDASGRQLKFNSGTSLKFKPEMGQSVQVKTKLKKPEGTALLLHTSGTTSRPKCVPLTHKNLIASVQNIVATYQLTPEDKTLVVMPLFHVHGLIGALFSTLQSGGTAVLSGKFSASKFWSTFIKYKCTWYSAVPTIHQILLRNEEDGSCREVGKLRFIRSCSSALLPDIQSRIESSFGVPVLQAYAMTEASHQMTSNPLGGPQKLGSVGHAQGGVQVGTFNGEIIVRGENVTSGYLNNDKANADSFVQVNGSIWFRTGDQGTIDKDGFVFLTGRLKELINRGGEKISPLEVDQVLTSYGGEVSDAVTFAAKDSIYGEVVHAAVILKAGSSVSDHQLISHCKQHLSSFKCPVKIYIVEDFPRTATGKVQRRIVADHFAQLSMSSKAKL